VHESDSHRPHDRELADKCAFAVFFLARPHAPPSSTAAAAAAAVAGKAVYLNNGPGAAPPHNFAPARSLIIARQQIDGRGGEAGSGRPWPPEARDGLPHRRREAGRPAAKK